MGFIYEFRNILGIGKRKAANDVEKYSAGVQKGAQNAEAHLKSAQFHQKAGETEKSIREYLLAADIFSQRELYPKALAIYKQILKQTPALEEVELKIAEVYVKMGSLEDAHSQYERLLRTYNKQGREDKTAEVMCLMAELSMQIIAMKGKVQTPPSLDNLQLSEPKAASATAGNVPKDLPILGEKKKGAFDLGATLATTPPVEVKGVSKITQEKTHGFEEILKELKKTKIPRKTYPDFNFHLGVACREMGFIDEAIAQFQIALEKGQNPCEAAHFLGRCFSDKGLLNDARHSFERALKVKGISQEKIQKIKEDLALIAAEKGRRPLFS